MRNISSDGGPRKTVSLSAHLFARLAAAGVAVAVAAVGAVLFVEARSHEAERAAEADRTAALVGATCEPFFYRNDWPQMEKTLGDIGKSRPEFLGARVVDLAGAVVADWSADPALRLASSPPRGSQKPEYGGADTTIGGKKVLAARRPLVSPVTGRRIGSLEITFDEERFARGQWKKAGGYAAVFAAVCLAMLLAMRVGVERALAPARRIVEEIRAASKTRSALSCAPTGISELDDLTGAFAQAYQAVREAERLLEENARARAMSEMAFGVAHDFNNFLATIVANNEKIERMLWRKPPPAEEIRAAIGNIDMATRNAEELIRKIFLLGRHPSSVPERTAFRADRVLKEAVGLLEGMWRAAAERRGVHYDVRLELEPVEVVGLAEDIRSVLVNLVVNAIDAMPGGGTINAGVVREGDYAFFFVEDEGPGVPEEIRHRIFEPFFTTKAPHGTGLGLAVGRRIAAAHGGRLECLFRRDNRTGARFVLAIPVGPPKPKAAPAAAPWGVAPVVRQEVILVDDDPLVLCAMKEIVESLGHSVTACRSGPEALALLPEKPCDVLLSDIGMPGMNGFDLARRVKALCPSARVILMSGWDLENGGNEQDRGVADAFLPKPFRRADVARIVGSAEKRGEDGTKT